MYSIFHLNHYEQHNLYYIPMYNIPHTQCTIYCTSFHAQYMLPSTFNIFHFTLTCTTHQSCHPTYAQKKVAGFYCSICEFLLSLLPIAKFYKKDNPPCKSEPTYLRDISHEIQHETSILHPRDLWRRIYSACTSKRWNLTYLF